MSHSKHAVLAYSSAGLMLFSLISVSGHLLLGQLPPGFLPPVPGSNGSSAGTTAATLLIDDSDATPAFSLPVGTWKTQQSPLGYKNNFHWTNANGSATWTFDKLKAGTTYDVRLTWKEYFFLSNTLQITVNGGQSDAQTVTIDETSPPSGDKVEDRPWQSLGKFTAHGATNSITVTMTNAGPNVAMADAVMLIETGSSDSSGQSSSSAIHCTSGIAMCAQPPVGCHYEKGADPCACGKLICESKCGNGTLEPTTGEQCDDGNTTNNDGCSNICKLEATSNLFVTESNHTGPQQLLGGKTQTESLWNLQLKTDTAAGVDVHAITVYVSGKPASIEQISILSADNGHMVMGIGTTADCPDALKNGPDTPFCIRIEGGVPLTVQMSQPSNILFVAQMKDDNNGARSGELIQLHLQPDSFSATEVNGGAQLRTNDGDNNAVGEVLIGTDAPGPNYSIVSQTHEVVLSSIKSVENGLSMPDGSPLTIEGKQMIGAFKIDASKNTNTKNGENRVIFKTLIFQVNAMNVGLDSNSFNLVSSVDPTRQLPCTPRTALLNTQSYIIVECQHVDTLLPGGIESDKTVSFGLQAKVIAPNASSHLQVMLSLSGLGNNTSEEIYGTDVAPFSWLDADSGSSVEHTQMNIGGPFFSTKFGKDSATSNGDGCGPQGCPITPSANNTNTNYTNAGGMYGSGGYGGMSGGR